MCRPVVLLQCLACLLYGLFSFCSIQLLHCLSKLQTILHQPIWQSELAAQLLPTCMSKRCYCLALFASLSTPCRMAGLWHPGLQHHPDFFLSCTHNPCIDCPCNHMYSVLKMNACFAGIWWRKARVTSAEGTIAQ